jgi:hypothetical protein
MTIYVLTLKTTAQHDAEKRADLNSFLKTMKRTFGLKCIGIEEKEVVERVKPAKAKRLSHNATQNQTSRRVHDSELKQL